MLFTVPCPTPAGLSADDLLAKRVEGITGEMQASASAHGCLFHRAWVAADRTAFHALACWESREGARAFYEQWSIEAEEGEVATLLEGDVGLVPKP